MCTANDKFITKVHVAARRGFCLIYNHPYSGCEQWRNVACWVLSGKCIVNLLVDSRLILTGGVRLHKSFYLITILVVQYVHELWNVLDS